MVKHSISRLQVKCSPGNSVERYVPWFMFCRWPRQTLKKILKLASQMEDALLRSDVMPSPPETDADPTSNPRQSRRLTRRQRDERHSTNLQQRSRRLERSSRSHHNSSWTSHSSPPPSHHHHHASSSRRLPSSDNLLRR